MQTDSGTLCARANVIQTLSLTPRAFATHYVFIVHKGLGARLLIRTETVAKARSCDEVGPELRDDNAAAFKLYTAHGYTLSGRKDGHYDDGAACLHMRKRVS